MKQGIFPSCWKKANVISVHKKGGKKDPDNYRPVSLLPICSKILEKVIYDQLLAHALRVLPQSQHGFLPRRSCVTNLACLLKHGWGSISEGSQTDIIYTDYSSAFTSVNHRLLLHKIQNSFNVNGRAFSWIESYLSGRMQRVVVDGKCSDWIPVTSGVPEGSICGPLLFVCYTSDIPLQVSTECLMYADDVKLFHRIRKPGDAQRLQADLDELSRWSKTWRLKLNASKCFVLTLTLKRQPVTTEYKLDGIVLSRCTEVRDLGVILDQKLTFASHVDRTVSQGNRMLGLLIRSTQASGYSNCGARARFKHKPLICAYNAHVRSVLEYGSVIWGGVSKTHFVRVERVQHKFLMWLSSVSPVASPSLSYSDLLRIFNMSSVGSRFMNDDISFLLNVVRARVNCMELLSSFSLSAPARLNRGLNLWHVPYARVTTVQNALFTRIPKTCNQFLAANRSSDMFVTPRGELTTAVRPYTASAAAAHVN